MSNHTGCARRDVIPRGHARIDERKGGGVKAGGKEGAVLAEDVEGQGDGGGRVEVREERVLEGRGEGGLDCLRASVWLVERGRAGLVSGQS